jgi:signal transduction histidine kinase
MAEQMLEAGVPQNESLRLRALRQLGLINSADSPRFHRITHTTALALDMPIVAITLIDDKEQWLLACEGALAQPIPRSLTFCGHAIASGEPLIVPDASRDARFADNPLVKAPAGIRFYAGHPLMSLDGYALGALCVIDHKPRSFDQRSSELLHGLAGWAQHELNAIERERQHMAALKKRLLAPAVHQVLGALTSIHGFSDFLLNNDIDESQRNDLLSTIHVQSEQVQSLVNELVELFQIESMAGRDLQLSLQPFAPLVRDAVTTCRSSDPHLRIELQMAEHLPTLLIDPNRMQHAVLQLLVNCLRRSSKQQDILVSLQLADNVGFVALEVHDRDPALKLESPKRMFEPFYRANKEDGGASAAYGLAAVKQIVELHGGTVSCRADTGQGIVVNVLLPIPH